MTEMTPEMLREWAKRNRNPWGRASAFPPDYDGRYCVVPRASLDAAASAWEADRKRLEEAERLLLAAALEHQGALDRIEALEPLASYGEKQLRREYEDEAGIESILSATRNEPSAHRSFEAFVAWRLAALTAKGSPNG